MGLEFLRVREILRLCRVESPLEGPILKRLFQLASELARAAAAGLLLQAIDQIDHVVETSSGAGADAAARDRNGQVGLAGPGAADQHGVALLREEIAGRQFPH